MEPLTVSALTATITALLDSAAGEAGKSAWAALTTATRRLLGNSSSEATVIALVDEAAIAPQSHDLPAASAQAAEVLLALAQRDHEFAELLAAWQANSTTIVNTTSNAANNVYGPVGGNSVQVGTNYGGINFNG